MYYGWRAKLGVITPANGTSMEMEFHEYVPDGVAVMTQRILFEKVDKEGLSALAGRSVEAAQILSSAKPDILLFGCTTGSLIQGLGYDAKLIAQLEKAAHIPAVTTSTALVAALKAMSIRKLVIYALNSQGYEAKGFERPAEFWKAMGQAQPDLVLLDIMLPEEDGLTILQKLRAAAGTKKLPVIMLTAKNTEYDRVVGLDSGADDFISKPFGMMELVARVRAVLRRTESREENSDYQIGALFVSPKRHVVKVDGEEVSLTNKEFELLCLLLEHQGMAMTRDAIMDGVWGQEFSRENRTLDVHVRTLRTKLGSAGHYIETVRGVGYKMGGEGA